MDRCDILFCVQLFLASIWHMTRPALLPYSWPFAFSFHNLPLMSCIYYVFLPVSGSHVLFLIVSRKHVLYCVESRNTHHCFCDPLT
jgi:hypothetical protein